MVDTGATEIEVSNMKRENIGMAIEKVLHEDYSYSDVIEQDLKNYTRFVVKGGGPTVKMSNEGMPTTVHIAELNENQKRSLWERIGDDNIWVASTISKRDEISGGRVGETDTTSPSEVRDFTNQGSSAGTGEVHKPFSHKDAGYVEPGDSGYNNNHPNCKDCAHYDDHGNCRIVPNVVQDGYCKKHYADAGFFVEGSRVGTTAHLVSVFWGEDYRKALEGSAAGKVVSDIKEKFKDKFGDRYTQF